MGPQLVEPGRASRHILPVFEPHAQNYVHHPQGQRRIGPRIDHQMLVSQCGRPRPIRIDHHQLRALAPRLFNERPQVHVVAMDIRAPRNDQPCMSKVLWRRPQLDPVHALQRHTARFRADRPVQLRGPKPMEEPPIHRPIPQLPDRPGIAVRQHALRPKLSHNLFELCSDLIQRLVPGDPLKRLSLSSLRQRSLWHPGPSPHRIQQSVRRIHAGPDTSSPSRTKIHVSQDATDHPAPSLPAQLPHPRSPARRMNRGSHVNKPHERPSSRPNRPPILLKLYP